MKVLFLDIDGVLNSTRTFIAFGGFPMDLSHSGAFDWAAIRMLQRLCDSAGVQVVLSSAWRQHISPSDAADAFGLPIIGSTPCLPTPRGDEIQQWLDAHPEVTHFAIVDDDADMLPSQEAFFVKTDPNEGLTWSCFQNLCELFGESPFAGAPRHRNWRTEPALSWSE